MRFAEVFLRLGCALVAWMLLYAYILWLAALYVVACGPDGDEMHRLMLGMAPFAAVTVWALRLTRSFTEIHSMLRWLSVPLILLLPFCLRTVWSVFSQVNISASPICSGAEIAGWQVLWSPAQLIAIIVIAIVIAGLWRTPSMPIDDKIRD